MNNKSSVWAMVALLTLPVAAHAQLEPVADGRFTVGDIRVEGLQRVSEGTVFTYLPVNIGDELNEQRLREALRTLYATGFFRTVELRRDDATLIIVVRERPSIESFEVTGNKEIKTEELTKSLRGVGLATGKTFDRSVLEEVRGYLTDQYFSRGRYGVKIDAQVDEFPDNRVRVFIDIDEGERARIRQINIVGNTKFKEKDILDALELKTPRWNSWYKQNDRYSRESLQGDLERLRSWYQDRGYANFEIESAQVAISDDKADMFITVSVLEGDVYTIADARIAGNTIVPQAELQRYVDLLRPGQIYSQQRISAIQKAIEDRLGMEGYAFATVDPVPRLDEEKKEVVMTFLVDPGKRVYVRHINFSGVTRTRDAVLRREMRQLEGAWVSNIALDRSRLRIQQLPYIESVDFEKTRVEGSDDLVDVDFTIKEGPSASLSGGVGYSQASNFVLNASYADSNFMGTGKRVGLELNTGRYSKMLSFSQTNPYIGIDNISRTISVRYTDVKQFVSASSDFSSKSFAAGIEFGYPITEFQYLRFGGNAARSQMLTTSTGSADQAQAWVQQNGNPFSRSAVDHFGNVFEFFGSRFTAFELTAGWNRHSLNRGLFPNRGQRQSLTLSSSVPGSAVEYWVGEYQFTQYVPIWGGFTGVLDMRVAYGDAFGTTTGLPPYRRFYAGGPDTVRGFRESRLGPKDSNSSFLGGNPYGGNLLTVGRAELLVPLPLKWQTSARLSMFYDIGNTFSTDDTGYLGRDGQTPVTYKFKYNNLRRSAGMSVEWLSPMGLFKFSYGIPLNASKGNNVLWADETERFQFTVGQAF